MWKHDSIWMWSNGFSKRVNATGTNRELQRFCSDYCRIRYQSEQGRIKNKPLKKKDYESRKLIRKLCLMLEPYRKLGDKDEM